jgi:hypothetical protein
MLDEPRPPLPAAPDGRPPAQPVQVPVDASRLSSTYTNFFRASGGVEELFLDFGLDVQQITPAGPVPIRLTRQLVMNYYTAKKLMHFLQWAVSRHESQFGVLELDLQHRLRQALHTAPTTNAPASCPAGLVLGRQPPDAVTTLSSETPLHFPARCRTTKALILSLARLNSDTRVTTTTPLPPAETPLWALASCRFPALSTATTWKSEAPRLSWVRAKDTTTLVRPMALSSMGTIVNPPLPLTPVPETAPPAKFS